MEKNLQKWTLQPLALGIQTIAYWHFIPDEKIKLTEFDSTGIKVNLEHWFKVMEIYLNAVKAGLTVFGGLTEPLKLTVSYNAPFHDRESFIYYDKSFEGLLVGIYDKSPGRNNFDELFPYLKKIIENIIDDDPKLFHSISISSSVGGGLLIHGEPVPYDNLFDVKLDENGLYIEVHNYAFLPNHPILRQRHYNIWAENAPRLANLIGEIYENSLFHLSLDTDLDDFGGPDFENPLFLKNNMFRGGFSPDWDETYVPYELINTLKK